MLAHAACADSHIMEVDAGFKSGGRANHGTPATRHQSPGAARRLPRQESLGQGVPGMKPTRLSRRLGLDGNPLRRRTDKIAACATALLRG
jgi:hypothetical protein